MGRTAGGICALTVALVGCGPAAAKPVAKPAPVSVEAPEATEEVGAEPGVVEAGPGASERSTLATCIDELRADPRLARGDDFAAYSAGFEHEKRGDSMAARRAYFELIKNTPQSPYVPLLYLAFGEIFTHEAQQDPSKWDLARQSYLEVVKYPPPNNPAYAYAWLMAARTEQNKGDFQHALADSMKAVEALRARPETACAAQIEDEARGVAIQAYAEVGAPNKAAMLFTRMAGDAAASWLASLAEEYLRRGKKADACTAIAAAEGLRSNELRALRSRACP